MAVGKVTWKDTGLTPIQVIWHRGRGIVEVCFNLGHLYPKMYTTSFVVLCFGVVVFAFGYVERSKTNLSLHGSELTSANHAYGEIRNADELAESFLPGAGREAAMERAEKSLVAMQVNIHSTKGYQASRIFNYYLSAVHQLPDRDYRCAKAKNDAHLAEDSYATGAISHQQWLDAEMALFHCWDERGKLMRVIAACQEESFTFVTGRNPPPLSLCEFRHDLPESSR